MSRLRQLTYGLVLLLAIAALLWIQHQRVQLAEAATDRAAARAAQAEQASVQRQSVITQLTTALAGERAAQISLRNQQGQIRQQLAARQQQIKELTHENQQLRNWARVHLPAAAQRLRQRPTITGAAGYTAWLSGSGAMPAAGHQPDHQRRAAD